MTDEPLVPSVAPEDQAPQAAAPMPTAGQMIKEARLASGLHIGTLSNTLKVPVKKLEALEADDWQTLPEMVFVRALATSVCRQINIDSAPVLEALPQTTSLKVEMQAERVPLNQPFRSPGDAKLTLANFGISMPMVMGALVLLLAALILIFLPTTPKETEQSKVQLQPVLSEPLSVMPPISSPSTTPNTSANVTVAPASLVSPSTSPVPAVAVNGSPILRIASKGVVWIEVKDSKGIVLVQRTLQSHEAVNVSGTPPLAVVIGRLNEIESISVRGKPLSTAGMSPDNVARFEVK